MSKERYTVKHLDGYYIDDAEREGSSLELGYNKGDIEYMRDVCDKLNLANEQQKPEPKSLEYFMGLDNGELNALTKSARGSLNTGIHYMHNESFYYSYLRPEMRKLNFHVDLLVDADFDVEFRLIRNGITHIKSITESDTNTPARIYTILFLLAKELSCNN